MKKIDFKNILINTFLVIFSILGTLFILECALRFLFSSNAINKGLLRVSQYQDIGFEYTPGAIAYFDNNKDVVKINSSGYRDNEFSTDKPDNTFRIICLGDSATYGHNIRELENTYPKKLETLLNETLPDKFEVYNMGVQAYNTHHEIATLKHRALKFKPDMIILTLNFGDSAHDWIIVKHGQIVTDLPFPPVVGKFLPETLNDFLLKNSLIYFNLEKELSDRVVPANQYNNYIKNNSSELLNANSDNTQKYNLDLIIEGKKICDKNKIKYVVAIMPWFNVPIYKKSPEYSFLQSLKYDLKKNNISYVDLFEPVLYENNKTNLNVENYTLSLRVSRQDQHPNEKALELYAKEIKDKIIHLFKI